MINLASYSEKGGRNLINKGIVGWSGISSSDGGRGGASER